MTATLQPAPGLAVTDADGNTWVTTDRAAHQLGVTHGLIRVWTTRHRTTLHRHRAGGRTWYRLDQLTRIEQKSNEQLTRHSAKRTDT